MAQYGGITATSYEPVVSALHGLKNELIAFKPLVTTGTGNDWWFAHPDGSGGAAIGPIDRGLMFYSQRGSALTDPTFGRFCWLDEQATSKVDFAWAVAGNRAATITGFFTFNPADQTNPPEGALYLKAPFKIGSGKTDVVQFLNADLTDGCHADQRTCANIAATTGTTIPVYKVGGRLSVGDPSENCDAVSLQYLQANLSGVVAKAPCQWATVAPLSVTVSGGNQLTSTVNGVFSPDPDTRPGIGDPVGNVVEDLAHRVLVKNQWTSGADSAAIPNGIYYLYQAGSPTTPYVLKRSSDANQDGELVRGNLVFIENGTQNAGSQWQLSDVAPGGSTVYGPPINPGVEPNWWSLFFKTSAYKAGNGIVIDGLTIHFAHKTAYVTNSLFYADTTSTVIELPLPTSETPRQFLWGRTASRPEWRAVDWADITGKLSCYPPCAHTHPPADIVGITGFPKTVAFFDPAGALAGDDRFTYDNLASQPVPLPGTPIGILKIGKTSTSGPILYYPTAPASLDPNFLTWEPTAGTSLGRVGQRPVSDIIAGIWPIQTGTVPRYARWGTTTTLTPAYLEDDTTKAVKGFEAGIDLGLSTLQFGTLYAGGANLGTLTCAFTLGALPKPEAVLGIDTSDPNRQLVKRYTSFPSSFVNLAINAVGYGDTSGLLTGNAGLLFFNGVQLKVPNGTLALPSITFQGESTSGFYWPTSEQVGVTIKGAAQFTFAEAGHISTRSISPSSTGISLGGATANWGDLYLTRNGSASAVVALAGWTTVNNGRIESLTSAKVRFWLGLSGTGGIAGSGTPDYFTLWHTSTALRDAPMKVDDPRTLTRSLRSFAPDTTSDVNPSIAGFDLGYSGGSEDSFGGDLLIGTNRTFNGNLGSWTAFGTQEVITNLSATRMAIAIPAEPPLSFLGAKLGVGSLAVVAGVTYQLLITGKVEGALPSAQVLWQIWDKDVGDHLTFPPGGNTFYLDGTDRTIALEFTAGVTTSNQQFSMVQLTVQPEAYQVSFDEVRVRQVTGVSVPATILRWRTLYIKDINVIGSIVPDTGKTVPLGSLSSAFSVLYTKAAVKAVALGFLAGWDGDPASTIQPLRQYSAADVRGFLSLTGTLNRVVKWGASGPTDSDVIQVGTAPASSSLTPATERGVDLGTAALRWKSFVTDAAAGGTVVALSGWDGDPASATVGAGQPLRQYTAAQVKTFLGLTGSVIGSGALDRVTKWTDTTGGLGNSQIAQANNELTPITDAAITLGKVSFRWSALWTSATAGTVSVNARLAGWDSDPSASTGQALKQFTPTDLRGIIYPGGTVNRITKWSSTTGGLIDSEITQPTGAMAPATDGAVDLGRLAGRWASLWTSAAAGVNPTASTMFAGWDLDPAGTTAQALKRFTPAQVLTSVGAVPITRTLGFVSDGSIIWTPTPAGTDLSTNRIWMAELDYGLLDTHWVTVDTVQEIIALKKWRSPLVSDPMIEMNIGADGVALPVPNVPGLRITAGGWLLFGNGVQQPTGSIKFLNDRMTVEVKNWEFAATSNLMLTSATTVTTTPFLLCLEASNYVRRIAPADVLTFIGQPTLANHAVGYGDATNKLTGNAAALYFDYTAGAQKLGIRCTPAETLDVFGTFRAFNTVATGSVVTNPGGQISINDTSTSTADWTSRQMNGLYVTTQKSGTAAFLTSGVVSSIVGNLTLSGGTLSTAYAIRSVINFGHATVGPSVTQAFSFYAGYGNLGALGSMTKLVSFYCEPLPAGFIVPTEVYGMQIPTMPSAGTRVAGIRLDLVSTGANERYNLYIPGTAQNYFAGYLGLGVTTPTARLDLAVGNTSLAPIRFAPTSAAAALLTTPLSGMFESRGDRLMFTDLVPTRHPLAYFDDVNFTNDPGGTPQGGVMFGQTAHMTAALDLTSTIGTGDFTLWARFKMPLVFRGPNGEGVCGIGTSAAIGSTYDNAGKIIVNSVGQVYFYLSATVSNYRVIKSPAPPGGIAYWNGQIVDVMVTRKGSLAPTMWINGVVQTVTDTPGGSPPTWDAAIDSYYLHAGMDFSNFGSVPEIYKVVFFNYGLGQAEVNDLIRYGRVDSADRWGSMTNKTILNPGFEGGFTGSVPTGWTKGSSATTADETVDRNSGAHATRFTGSGLGSTIANLFYQPCLAPLKRHLAKAFVKRVSGTGQLHFGPGAHYYGLVGLYAYTSTAASWTQIGGISKFDGGRFGAENTYLSFATSVAGDVWLIDDVTLQQVGAVADMDFGVGCGSIIPDRSGRYPGTMSIGSPTTSWEHIIPTCPVEVNVGVAVPPKYGVPTVARNLRRYTQTVYAWDNEVVPVAHNFNTLNLHVAVWTASDLNASGAGVLFAVNRTSGSELNSVDIRFAQVGSPSVRIPFTVVIIG